MIAYKGFTEDLTATYGEGIFQYETGRTYTEDKSKTRNAGFHCAEYIFDCMTWYPLDGRNRFFKVRAEGSIDEEAECSMVVCTEVTLLRELTVKEIAGYAMMYMVEHPLREWKKSMTNVMAAAHSAEARKRGSIAVARGPEPRVKGAPGSVLGLILEPKRGQIVQARVFTAGEDVKPDVWYTMTAGGRLKEL